MIDHVSVEVADLQRSAAFYDAVFFALGSRRMLSSEDAIAYGTVARTFWTKLNPSAIAGSSHIALKAVGKRAVDAAYEVGLSHGGTDDGAPGPRPYGPRYYAAYLRDPDGYRIEIVTGAS